MTIGILALQGDFEAHAAALAGTGSAIRFVRRPEDLEGLDAIILPGGESTTMLKLMEEEGLFDPLQAFVRRQPVFATCAGAILLARQVTAPEQKSFGVLDVAVRRNAYGRQLESSIGRAAVDPKFSPELGSELEAVLIRAPQFRDLGPEVEVVARAGSEALLIRQGKILAASFHPELSPGSPVHGWFVQSVGSRLLQSR